MYLFYSGRELCLASSVHDMYVRAETQRRPGSIHSDISSAHDCDFLSCSDRGIVRIVKCLHQIASRQVFICGKYFIRILPRDAHKHRKACSRTDKHSFKSFIFHELVNGRGFSDHNVCLKFNAKLFYFLDLFCDNLLFRETELRDPVYKHPAELMERLKYSHIVSHLRQVARTGKTGRAGTDHSHFMSVLCLRADRLDVILKCIVSHKSLQFSDGHRLALNAADTFSFALGLLRADTSADCRERAGSSDHFVRFLDISFLYFMDERRDVDRNRTALDTFCILAVEASRCLFHRLFQIIPEADLIKICRAYFGILLSDRNFL